MANRRQPNSPSPKPVAVDRSGASGSRVRLRDRCSSYFRHHRRDCRESFQRLTASPAQSLMTALVIAIALALPAMLYVGVLNLQQLSGGIKASARLSLFLNPGIKPDAIKSLAAEISAMPQVKAVTHISREAALEEFQALSGFGDALRLLDENPLPPVLLITPADSLANDLKTAENLAGQLGSLRLVDDVRLDMKWLQRLQSLLEIGRRIALALGAALALGVLLIVGNTIRLAIENRRDEIIVVKLVGGTNAYVRRPFLYTGLIYGVVGGLAAWLLVWLGLAWLDDAVARLAILYHSRFSLQGLGTQGLLTLTLVGGTLGLGGTWLAVSQHLQKIEPQ